MINFRFQVMTAKGDARQTLYVAGTKKAAIEYLDFLLSKRDLNESLEYIIRPVMFISEDPEPTPEPAAKYSQIQVKRT